mmetsp:Transcript_16830/g.20763  ORF Transcript_16830/g.20763 Transcript_16830/m.20763 type:complete len:269 (+) Transcript_16830:54-860(+)|eukprot:CAMPEP_0204831898 /NCGR_PEP_ID=MMETSP1346-20131115/12033_1 /ASSEMBLY_ACC=CAM_ASM_000771 /TAXON_ID=215587 /ORGANISM="Aplanochytrium stocchinoi, Strain GSBS06" /LENGTH=268 /DNA_ID=CAMNT_0051963331 /DNA_START=126 /DNA_END=932 /DNA_ORIENTATION=-
MVDSVAPDSPRRRSSKDNGFRKVKAPNSPRRNSKVLRGNEAPKTLRGDSASRVVSYSLMKRSASFDLKSEVLQREYGEYKDNNETNASASADGETKGNNKFSGLSVDVGAGNPLGELPTKRRASKVVSIIEYDEDRNETRIVSPLALQLGNPNAAFSFDLNGGPNRTSPLTQYRKEKHRAVMYKRFVPYMRLCESEPDYGTTYSTFLLVNPYTWDSIDGPTESFYSEDERPRQLKLSPITTYKTYVTTTDEITGQKMVTTFTQQFQGL